MAPEEVGRGVVRRGRVDLIEERSASERPSHGRSCANDRGEEQGTGAGIAMDPPEEAWQAGGMLRASVLVSSLLVLVACSGADGVFGESSSASGAGGDGGQGDGAGGPTTATSAGGSAGDGGAGAGGPGSSTGNTTTTTTTAAGQGGGTTVSSTAAGANCGDGVLNAAEQCDGQDLGGSTCLDHGFSGGTLACQASCLFSFEGCTGCGNGAIEAGEQCDDGNASSNDGCSASCQAEGLGCQSAIEVGLSAGEERTFDLSNVGGSNASTCDSEGAGRSFEVTAATSGFLTATVVREGTAFDSVLTIRRSCATSALLCADAYLDGDPSHGGEVGSVQVQAGDSVVVQVHSYGDEEGDFSLHLALSRGTCADPVVVRLVRSDSGMAALHDTTGQGDDVEAGDCETTSDDLTYLLVPTDGVTQFDVAPETEELEPVLYTQTTCGQVATETRCNEQGVMIQVPIPSPLYFHVDGFVSEGAYLARWAAR